MADLSQYINEIKSSATGAEARQPITAALKLLNEQGRETATLNYKTDADLAKRSDMGSLLPMDTKPKENSKKLATSGGIFAMIGDMDDFNWGSDDWLI